jgi:hypothetical protein
MESRNLRHDEFVNHYYGSSEWCHLYLLLSNPDEVIGTVGVERMPFRYRGNDLTVGFGTNYHSLKPGAGGFLYRHWLKSCQLAISLGGSEDAHRILKSQKWPYFDGIKRLCLNKPYGAYPGDAPWKRAAKWLVRHTMRHPIGNYASRIPASVLNRIHVREEGTYSDDLLPQNSPFEFRFTPGADYLNWRYRLGMPFIRYRLFRIVANEGYAGYVIFNEKPDQIIVSQCDADDYETLAWGVLSSLVKLAAADRKARSVTLTCANRRMEEIYAKFGFKVESDQPLAFGSLVRNVAPPAGSDTSNWLINFDWGDNGMLDLLNTTA